MSQVYSFVGRVTVSDSLSAAGLRKLRKYLERAVCLDLDTEEHGTEICDDVSFEGIELNYSQLEAIPQFFDLEDLLGVEYDVQTHELNNGGCLQFDGDEIRYIDSDGNTENIYRPGDEDFDEYRKLFPPLEFKVVADTLCELIVNSQDLIGHPDFHELAALSSSFEGEFTPKQVAEALNITVEASVSLLQRAYDESYIEVHAKD